VIPRIVSLLPSATEVVCALGLADALVGRSHECDFPAGVERLPVCTAPKIDVSGDSARIHGDVQAHVRDSISVYTIDSDLMRSLLPTHVITQVQCEVCAVSVGEVRKTLLQWDGEPPEVISLRAGSLEDVFADFNLVAASLGTPGAGRELVRSCSERISAIARRSRECRGRPRVACLDWLSPLMAAGNWIPELVELAGGRNLFGAAGQHSPWMEWEELASSDPDVLLLFPCGFTIEETERDLHFLTSREAWTKLRAVREGKVFVADGKQYFNRPGPRLVETLEILAELLHPEEFSFGHRGRSWQPVACMGYA
jgi:iron complex transport system substrate-binding protein